MTSNDRSFTTGKAATEILMNAYRNNKLRASVSVIQMTRIPDGVFAFAAGRGIPIKS